MFKVSLCIAVVAVLSGCATVVEGHERALYFSASQGLQKDLVDSGWHFHLPWNQYRVYDMRWAAHAEDVHIHSRDNLHLDVNLAVVVRPTPATLWELDTTVGPEWYESLVRPALFAAARDASAKFTHLEIATQTHEFETAVRTALLEHLEGKHLELGEVAVQHFDLPPEVEAGANKKAASSQALAAKEVDLKLAERDAQIDQSKRRAAAETISLERRLKAQSDLEQAQLDMQIEKERQKAAHVRLEAEADALKMRAASESAAVRIRAEAEKERILAVASSLNSNYVRLQAIEAMGKTLSGPNSHVYVLPSGKDGLPAFFQPFMNPYGPYFGNASAGLSDDRPDKAHP